MIRLISVEFRRFFARDVTRLFGGLIVLGVIAGGIGAWSSSSEMPIADQLDRQLETLRADHRNRFEHCMEPPDEASIPEDLPPEFRERALRGPTERQCRRSVAGAFLSGRDDRFQFGPVWLTVAFALIGPFVALTFVTGATFVGAEWAAGTMTSSFNFEPRRLRVLGAKAIAVVLASVVFLFVVLALIGLAFLPTGLGSRGTMAGVDQPWLWSAVDLAWRGAVLAGFGGLLGLGLANLVRRTSGTLGIASAWVFLIEGFLGRFTEAYQSWSITRNLAIAVVGEEPGLIEGRSVEEALLLLSAYSLGIFLIGAYMFWRRDVAAE